MRCRATVRTAMLAGLLLTPAIGAAGEPLRATAVSRLGAVLPSVIDAVWRQLPWVTAPSETPTGGAVPEGDAPGPSSVGSQDGEAGPGWDPDGLAAGTDNDTSRSETGSSS
jgi:hypothetical protein